MSARRPRLGAHGAPSFEHPKRAPARWGLLVRCLLPALAWAQPNPGPSGKAPGPLDKAPGPLDKAPGPLDKAPGAKGKAPGPIYKGEGSGKSGSTGKAPGPIDKTRPPDNR